jgi:hypothetical protein
LRKPSAIDDLLRHVLKGRVNRQYHQHGYHVFRSAFPAEQVSTLADLARRLITPYGGLIRRQDGEPAFNEFFPGTQLVQNAPLNAHLSLPEGLESVSATLRALVTSAALGERLRQLDGDEHYTIHQTILFMSAPTTDIHLDSWSIDTAPRGFAHTAWIPLQDMDITSGVPSVIPWPRGKLVTEAELGLADDGPVNERYDRYHRALAARLLKGTPEAITPLMRKGDFIVWSSLTPHFTLPSRPWPTERLALQVLIRPTRSTWGNFYIQPARWSIDRAVRVSERFSFLVT